MGRKDSLPADAPAIRLCEMVKWPHFQGYGFNLHSEKGKEGQFVGKIDPASPAEACGLLEGDQIVEVNGVNTSNENHKQVVERIKTDPDHVSLLVVDQVAAEFYKKRGVVINGSLSSVKAAARSSSTSAGQDQETGESETSSQDQLSIEDTLAFAAQSQGDDEPPPVPPKTDLSLETDDKSASDETVEEAEEKSTPEEPSEKSEEASEPTSMSEEASESASDDTTLVASDETAPAAEAAQEVEAEKAEEEAAPSTEPAEEAKPAEEASPAVEAEPSPPVTEDATDAAEVTEVAEVAEVAEEPPSETKAAEKAAEKKASVPKEETPRIDTTLQVEGSGSDRAQPSPAPSADSTGTVESAKSAESTKSSGSEPDKFGLKLNMSAAEMREYLKSKKRHDPRNDNLSFKQRHEIVQNM